MLVYAQPESRQPPPCLEGASNLMHWGDMWWSGPSAQLVRPDPDALSWRELPTGWRVAIYGERPEDAQPAPRDINWSLVIPVRDARDRTWLVPALLTPHGTPAIAQVGRLDCHTGEWVNEDPNPTAASAMRIAETIRGIDDLADLEFGQLAEWTAAVMAAAYHADVVTFGVLGLVDTVLMNHGLRAAAGLLTEHLTDGT